MKFSSEIGREEEKKNSSSDRKVTCVQPKSTSFCSLDKALKEIGKSADEYVESVKQFCNLACNMEITTKLMNKPKEITECNEIKRLLRFISGDDSDDCVEGIS